jgi:hypothetical protein
MAYLVLIWVDAEENKTERRAAGEKPVANG